MSDQEIIRLVTLLCGTAVVGIGGTVACSVIRYEGSRWWLAISGLLVAVLIVLVGLRLFSSGTLLWEY